MREKHTAVVAATSRRRFFVRRLAPGAVLVHRAVLAANGTDASWNNAAAITHEETMRQHEIEVEAGHWAFAQPLWTEKQDECPVCCERAALIMPEQKAGPYMTACFHAACEACWSKWIEGQLARCAAEKVLRATCIFCPKSLPQRMVFQLSPAACQLAEQIEHRFRLQESQLYPTCMQVDCKAVGCVGIGYLGFDRIMCFVCQEQWDAETETVMDQPCALAQGVKACPKCGVPIIKDGGCDHMTCKLCKHEWFWSSGAPFRSSWR